MTESDHRGMVLAQGGLALAALVYLAAQTRTVFLEKPMLEAQKTFLVQRLSALKTTDKQTGEAIEKREFQIKRGQELEAKYAAMLTELLELSKVDPDARALTLKWKIQSSQPSLDAPITPLPLGTTPARPLGLPHPKCP